jgi:hypothetical protein
VRFLVSCEPCFGADPIAECPNRFDAEQVACRHHGLRGHDATITRVLDTPHEGLLQ